MAKNSPLDVSAWIRRLGPDFKDSITPYGLSCIFPYHQIRVDDPLLCAAANYWVPSQHVSTLMEQNYTPLSRNLLLLWVNQTELEIDDLIFPTMGGDLPPCCKSCQASLPPRQIGGMSMGSLTLNWSLSIFLIQPFLWVRGHAYTFFVSFAYVLLQGISWFKTRIVLTFGCA